MVSAMGRAIFGAGALVALAVVLRAKPVVPAFERFHRDTMERSEDAIEGGLLLLNELNCVACHEAPAAWRPRVPGRGKISLEGAGSRMNEEALRAFVTAPHATKPGTTMPAMMPAEPAAGEMIAAYLASLKTETATFPAGDPERGRKVYESVGCAACHAPAGETTTYASVSIGLAQHYERDALVAFLLDPLRTRPSGRMPATELTEREASDVAAYLQAGRTHAEASAVAGAAVDVKRGRAEYVARNCAACHDVEEGAGGPGPRAKSLDSLDVERGCLAIEPGRDAPHFDLDGAQRSALRSAVLAIQAAPAPAAFSAEQRVVAKFEQLNCYACHEWRGRGGAEPARAKFFTSVDAADSLGEIGHLPPELDQAGRKLTPAWLEKLLWGKGGGVRPYMTARMPKFGEEAAGALVSLLAEACRPEQPQEIDVSGRKSHQRFETGRILLGVGTGGLGCVACHGLKHRESPGVRAINLTHTAQRLRPEYFKALLLDPHRLQPGTIMPPLFAGRANANKEIESLWTYFKELDQSDVLPEGLAVAGSFELKPEAEGRPIVFRTFLEHAGTQAIAVGFPEGVHAAFDAFEARWALVWRGRFLDAQSNWEERPMIPIKALGGSPRVLPATMPLAKLAHGGEPWPETFGAYAGYQFKGYRIGQNGAPTFRYSVDGIEVEDTLRPAVDGTGFRRTIVLRSGSSGSKGGGAWYFRGLAPDAIARPVEWRDGKATMEEIVTF